VNIYTHLIPLVFWALTLLPYSPFALPSIAHADGIELIFTGFTLLCMFNSSLWHTMAGCADPHAVEMCARIDYVGIGWYVSTLFISCSGRSDLFNRHMSITEGTIVYYGFQEHTTFRVFWLSTSTLVFLARTIFPFMDWFNDVKHRVRAFYLSQSSFYSFICRLQNWRIFFFVCIGFTSMAPMLHLAYIYGGMNMLAYMGMSILSSSCLSYFDGSSLV
jgi:adiponectin receptor